MGKATSPSDLFCLPSAASAPWRDALLSSEVASRHGAKLAKEQPAPACPAYSPPPANFAFPPAVAHGYNYRNEVQSAKPDDRGHAGLRGEFSVAVNGLDSARDRVLVESRATDSYVRRRSRGCDCCRSRAGSLLQL